MKTITAAIFFLALISGGGQARAVEYQSGYDPEKERPEGVNEIPEAAWGEEKDGLRAAISAPTKIRYNEPFQMHFVVRNVSDKAVRVTFRSLAHHPIITPAKSPAAYGGYSNDNHFNRWEMAPGHEVAIPFPVKTVVRGDGIAPTHAVRNLKPGPHQVASGLGAGGENWGVYRPDGQARRVVYGKDEWTGHLRTRPHALELLDEEIELEIPAPAEFGEGHGFLPVLEHPDSAAFGGEAFGLRDGLALHLNETADEHWFMEAGNYDRNIFWGPFDAATLEKLKLLDPIAERLRRDLTGDDRQKHDSALWEMRKLASRQRPFVELVFDLAPSIAEPRPGLVNNGHDFLARAIRDRRVELRELGLAKETAAALEVLDAHLPSLPPEKEFKIVAAAENSPDAPVDGDDWGPENDGLRAAAVMELKDIASGTAVPARLFIRNVSREPVFMTVSDRSGYDHASAVDVKGVELKVERELVYPMFFSSVIRPEIDPGLSAQNPPNAKLVKIKLEPGAVWELETKTELQFFRPGAKRESFQSNLQPGDAARPAISTIVSQPTDAVVTWQLRTANGAEYAKDLRSRHWPARGGWSGVLETAPIKVKLSGD